MGAALDLPGRNDRAIAVIIALGPKVPSGGLRPDVPRGLAFFWGETETVGATYLYSAPPGADWGPLTVRLSPHQVHGPAAWRCRDGANRSREPPRGVSAAVPDYWQEHHQVPPVVGVSFKARSDRTASLTIARLYSVLSGRPGVNTPPPKKSHIPSMKW